MIKGQDDDEVGQHYHNCSPKPTLPVPKAIEILYDYVCRYTSICEFEQAIN